MSDIFSLNGCYLNAKDGSPPYNTCSPVQLATAKTLLTADTSEVNKAAANLITGNSNSETIGSQEDANIINAALSAMELNQKNTKRSIQINSYYAKKHTDQNYILKVVYIMVIIVVIMWTFQTYTSILPDWFYSAGMSITIGVCSIIIIFKSADISNRSTFDYDQKINRMKNLPPLDEQNSLYRSGDQQIKSSSSFAKNCQNGDCCPKFFSFNPSLGYCSFQPFSLS